MEKQMEEKIQEATFAYLEKLEEITNEDFTWVFGAVMSNAVNAVSTICSQIPNALDKLDYINSVADHFKERIKALVFGGQNEKTN